MIGILKKTASGILTAFLIFLPAICDAEDPKKDEINFTKPVVYTLSLMAVGYGALLLTDEFDYPSYTTFRSSYNSWPKRDPDSWTYNYVGHPLWGSETYLRAREANFGMIGSIAFNMAASLFWEYLVESWSEHASIQDLIITTGAGWIIGEIRYRIKNVIDPDYYFFIDPINTLLEHTSVSLSRDEEGHISPSISFAWVF